jgi:hypothetical protein
MDLLPHQRRFIERFKGGLSRQILWWSAGSGKTLAAVSAVEHVLTTTEDFVVVACPLSVVDMWKRCLSHVESARVAVVTHDALSRRRSRVNQLVIIDEMHAFRTDLQSSVRVQRVVRLCREARFFVGLSATMVVNSASDLHNAYLMLDPSVTEIPGGDVDHLMYPGLDLYQSSQDGLAAVKYHADRVFMEPDDGYMPLYCALVDRESRLHLHKDPMKFLCGLRALAPRLANMTESEIRVTAKGITVEDVEIPMSPESVSRFRKNGRLVSPKTTRMIELAARGVKSGTKVLMWTEFIGSGVDHLAEGCREMGLSVSVVTGTMRAEERAAQVARYNNRAPKC